MRKEAGHVADDETLITHYTGLVLTIQTMLLARAPRFARPSGLTSAEVRMIAEGFAAGHTIAGGPGVPLRTVA